MVRSTLSIFLLALMILPCFASGDTLSVKAVHTGNLIELEGGLMLRLVGVKVPGMDEPNGQKAYTYLKHTIEGKSVRLLTWSADTTAAGVVRDEQGHMFGEIWYGSEYEIELNGEMLKLGLGIIDPIHMPEEKAVAYKSYEDMAKKNRQGIWAEVK